MRENLAAAEPARETIKIAGLARLGAAVFAAWGGLVFSKGVYDRLLGGQPEANLYAPKPWAFVTEAQWARYGSFELVYGLACLAVALFCRRWSRRLPETVSRKRREPEFSLFGE